MSGQSCAADEGGFEGFPNPRAARQAMRAAFMMRGGEPRAHRGGGPWGEPFGYGGPRGGFRGRHGKARRGDIRTAVLLLLAEEPRNGYSIMQELEQRSGGIWRPSPGSVYPALSQLEDEGLIRSEEQDGRKAFGLTDAGRDQLAARPADAPAPWDTLAGGVSTDVRDVMGQLRQVAAAAAQLARTASEPQLAEAKKVLSEARRALYRILADGEGDE
ncbi:MAG: PadR family transcriptional regulator [Solirubrobacteraceae bacterium]|jgi:DNA-binding PadR family transcriptional regulator